MLAIYKKELIGFFSSLTGYIVIGVFLIITGLFMWLFTDTSVLEYSYASLDTLFYLGPVLFTFLIPSITMKSFSEERQKQTLELLFTKPLSNTQIILGKYLAYLTLVFFAVLLTLVYYFSIYQLGAPKGNIDSGAVLGSYIGLLLLGAVFVSIGVFSSALTKNQVVAFIIAIMLSFLIHWGFDFISKLPVFWGVWDDFIQKFGIDYHYKSISKGLIDTKDLIYFVSVIIVFLLLTDFVLKKRKY
ncbi:MAG TPA: gliding motility-associated ABC transporter permease subunit GldF [Bacteroidetes bacterium]|nr:gliding motility-associated ABC transporter permease subunit GldF [Bacteroidota bacterium]